MPCLFAYLLPSGILLSAPSKEKRLKTLYSQSLKENGKEKEGKMAAVFQYPLLLCFFLYFFQKKKHWKSSVYRVLRGIREKEDYIYHRNFYDGSRTRIFSVLRMAKKVALGDGERREPLGNKSPRSWKFNVFWFLQKLFSVSEIIEVWESRV